MNISKLVKKIKDYRIIGLGEATHGQLKLNEFRNNLIKKLVIKYNFTVIVLEDQYSCAKIINKYIKNKIKDINIILTFPYLSTIFMDLLIWLKKYNEKNNNIISIIGVDCQYSCNEYKSKTKLNNYVNNLIKKYNTLKSLNCRDKYMYKIFMKQFNNNNKYLILSHNTHLQKESTNKIKWFGNYLYEKFINNYLVIDNTFYNGTYLAKDIDNNYNIDIAKINVEKELDTVIYDGSVLFSSKNPNKTFYKSKLNNKFDILLVINNEKSFILQK